MSCAGCGFDERLARLIIRDELRRQIDENKIQEALQSCEGEYLKKDMEVATCEFVGNEIGELRQDLQNEMQTLYDDEGNLLVDNDRVVLVRRLGALICQLMEDGDLCFTQVTGLTVTRDVDGSAKLNVIFNNGDDHLEVKLPDPKTTTGGSIDLETNELTIKSNSNTLARINIEDINPTGNFNGVQLKGKTLQFTKQNEEGVAELDLTPIVPDFAQSEHRPTAVASSGMKAQYGSGQTVLATPDGWVEIIPGFLTPVYRKA